MFVTFKSLQALMDYVTVLPEFLAYDYVPGDRMYTYMIAVYLRRE